MQKEIEKFYSFFDHLDIKEKEKFFSNAKRVHFQKDEILFWQGDLCEGVLYLESGSIRLYIQNDEASEITLYTLNPGEQCVINTSSAISSTPALGTAVTLSEVRGYILDSKCLKDLMVCSEIYREYIFCIYNKINIIGYTN